ncbi:MAG: HEAT repeat domain-containing protein [Planctomycetia bacterium]|nr:HEAT repeat domain-containing protein [Planctomycetia bacterium]
MPRTFFPIAPLLALTLAVAVAADTVWLQDDVSYKGKVVSEADGEVLLNPYNSTMKEMVWGLKRFDRSVVAKLEITPEDPLRKYWFDSSEPKADHVALMKFCRANGLEVEAREEALEVLDADIGNAEARAGLGASVNEIIAASPRHNPGLREATKDWAALGATERRERYAKLKKDFGVTLPIQYFDRVARSERHAAGVVTEDIHLTYNSQRASGVYTVWLPKNYNPHRAYPMVLALHGTWNGLGGIGEGHTFVKHFTYAETKKWDVIVVAPTADPRPWTAKGDTYVLSVIDEACLQYNIDMNRIYVTGHSMGGGGTWHFGTKYPEKFAAFAPAAAAGSGNELDAAAQGTGMYIYHSSDDPSAPVARDPLAAKRLRDADADFVYTEWTDQQHGWPQAVIADSFLYFRRHHRMNKGPKGPEPIHGTRPSFAEPLWPDEERYFPATRAPGRPGELEDLLAEVALGGTIAKAAADRLLELRNPAAVKPLIAVLRDLRADCHEARFQAARALGAVPSVAASSALLGAIEDPSWKVRRAAAEALATAAGAEESPWLALAVHRLGHEFDALAARWIRDETWAELHAFNAALVATFAAWGDPAAWTVVDEICIRRILLTEAKSGSDNIDPEPVRRASAVRILGALPALDAPSAKEAVDAIRKRLDSPEVKAAADDAEKKIGG